MRRILLASHGDLAVGIHDTLKMIVGDIPHVYTLTLTRDDKQAMADKARELFSTFLPDDEIVVLTDMLGSSVNNDMVSLLPEYPRMQLLSGMNMPLVLSLATFDESLLSTEDISELIDLAKDGVTHCNPLVFGDLDDGEDDNL